MKIRLLGCFLLAFAVSASLQVYAATSMQQGQSGIISLTVNDSSGSAVIATGKLINLATGVERTFQTNAQGIIEIAQLPFGRYRLEVAQTGFATQTLLLDVQSN